MFMDLVLEGLLREHLMVAPLLVIVGITEQLVTMGAEDFKVIYNLYYGRHVWVALDIEFITANSSCNARQPDSCCIYNL